MNQRGFSLIEMMMVVLVFTILTGAVFALLDASQQRYQIESQVLDQFQSARLAMDQITRDVHVAGYPPVSIIPPAIACATPQVVAYPFAWSPNYLPPSCAGGAVAQCTVGATCNTPGPFDLIIETDLDPENANGVEWVRYRLNGTTLERGVVSKIPNADPAAMTLPVMIPYVENVMNNTTAAEMAQIQATHPAMFPGNAVVPLFGYVFTPGGTGPSQIQEVMVTLIVRAARPDPRTGQLRLVTLTGLARRINPN